MNSGAAIPDELRVLSTCPELPEIEADGYLARVADAARQAERAGHVGLLVTSDARLADPWIVAHTVIGATERLEPLVTVQPTYQHPYAAAKSVASMAALHRRPVSMVLAAGGFRHDLLAMGDRLSHQARYDRLQEFGSLLRDLLGPGKATLEGEHYRAFDLTLAPRVPPSLKPRLYVAGTSERGRMAADRLGATRVVPAGLDDAPLAGDVCLRVGLVVREEAREAWRVAEERFPLDRHGRLRQRLALRWTDSRWQRDLHRMARRPRRHQDPYWLRPFECRRAFCPYLVGDHRTVAAELARYMRRGVREFLLDVPYGADDLRHAGEVLRRAWGRASRRLALTG